MQFLFSWLVTWNYRGDSYYGEAWPIKCMQLLCMFSQRKGQERENSVLVLYWLDILNWDKKHSRSNWFFLSVSFPINKSKLIRRTNREARSWSSNFLRTKVHHIVNLIWAVLVISNQDNNLKKKPHQDYTSQEKKSPVFIMSIKSTITSIDMIWWYQSSMLVKEQIWKQQKKIKEAKGWII